jgi:hypothetical protein
VPGHACTQVHLRRLERHTTHHTRR